MEAQEKDKINAEVFDPSAFESLSEFLGEDYFEYLHQYIDSTRDLINEISEAAAAGDTKSVIEMCHKVKGAGSNLGISSLTVQCQYIEESLKKNVDIDLNKELVKIKELYDVMEKEIRCLLHS